MLRDPSLQKYFAMCNLNNLDDVTVSMNFSGVCAIATSASAMHRSIELGVVRVGTSNMPVNTATTLQHMAWNSITTVFDGVVT